MRLKRRRRLWGLLGLLAAGTLVRAAVLAGYERTLDSEEAVWALQAMRAMPGAPRQPYRPLHYVLVRHPHELGVALPIYAGGLLFRALGVGAARFKLMGLLLWLPLPPLTYWFAWRHWGRRMAGFAALTAALGPPMFVKWTLKPYYFHAAIAANLVLADLALSVLFDGRRGWRRCFLLGLVAGLAQINAPFALPMLVAIALTWLLFARDALRPAPVLACAAGYAAAMGPRLLLDWRCGWPYVSMLTRRASHAPLAEMARALTVKLSYLFGQTAVIEGAAPHTPASLVYFSLFAVGLLGLTIRLAPAAVRAAAHPSRPKPKGLFLLAFTWTYLLAWAHTAQEMRYLIAMLPLALLPLGLLVDAWRPGPRAAVVALLAAAGAWGAMRFAASPKRGWDRLDYWRPEYAPLLQRLHRLGIRAVYTDRFTGAHLMFASRGRITAYHNFAAWPAYRRVVDAAPRYAFVYQRGSYYADALDQALRFRGVQAQRKRVGDLLVVCNLAPALRLADIPGLDTPTHGCSWDEQAWRDALRLDPNWTRRRVQLAAGLYADGRTKEAEAELREAIRRDPRAAAAYALLGAISGREGDAARRDELWRRAAYAAPEGVSIVRRLQRAAPERWPAILLDPNLMPGR